MAVPGTLNQGSPSEADQTRILQFTWWSSDLCAWFSLVSSVGAWREGSAYSGTSAALEYSWREKNRQTDKHRQEARVLRKIDDLWGKKVLHIWDRGFAGRPWLTLTFTNAVRFVLRWPKHYKPMDLHGNLRKAWEIKRGKRSWDHRYLWDVRRRCYRETGIVTYEVMDPNGDVPLWLVVARRGQGQLH